jgi:hypothetical protein
MDVVLVKNCLGTRQKYSLSSWVYHFARLQCGEVSSKKLKEHTDATNFCNCLACFADFIRLEVQETIAGVFG